MTRKAIIMWTLAIVGLAGAGSASSRACQTRPAASVQAPDAAAEAGLSGESIFGLDLDLVDAEGSTRHLSDLGGHTLVAAMMYTTCTSVCPRITEDMKAVERQLDALDLDPVTFVLFSLDPGRDTPAALRRFAVEHQLDASRWQLFAAPDEGVRDLAAVLGVRFKREDGGEIAHSATIFVVDRHGVVRLRQLGLIDNTRGLVNAIRRAQS